MKKTLKNMALLLGISLTTIHCGGGGNTSTNDLKSKLTTHDSFSLDPDNLASLAEDCGGVGGTPTAANAASTLALATSDGPAAQTTGGTSEITVSFNATTFHMDVNGEETVSGTWKVVDANTIQITVDGDTVTLDVSIVGDDLNLSLTAGANSDCSPMTGGTNTDQTGNPGGTIMGVAPGAGNSNSGGETVTDTPAETPLGYLRSFPEWIKTGTWCFDSGYQTVSDATPRVVESLLFLPDGETAYVKHFGDASYRRFTFYIANTYDADHHIFDMRAFNGAIYQGKFQVNGDDTISAAYGPYKSTLKWLGEEITTCPAP